MIPRPLQGLGPLCRACDGEALSNVYRRCRKRRHNSWRVCSRIVVIIIIIINNIIIILIVVIIILGVSVVK